MKNHKLEEIAELLKEEKEKNSFNYIESLYDISKKHNVSFHDLVVLASTNLNIHFNEELYHIHNALTLLIENLNDYYISKNLNTEERKLLFDEVLSYVNPILLTQ